MEEVYKHPRFGEIRDLKYHQGYLYAAFKQHHGNDLAGEVRRIKI
jgi:hypothetical protein